jgi:hypothetical protein
MKYLFWILLLGNVILFAVMQVGGFGWREQSAHVQPELNSEMIRLVPASQSTASKTVSAPMPTPAPLRAPVPALTAAAPVILSPASAPATTTLSSNAPLLQTMETPTDAKPDALVCLEWGDFSGGDLKRATAAVAALKLADKLSQRKIDRDMGYWVYFPPLKNKAVVKQKVAELKSLGINEYFVVQTPGHLLNAISLGVFKTQEAAQNFLDHIRTKGVRTAKIGEHASKLKATLFVFNGVDAATEVKLAAMQKDFAGTELKKVSCTHVEGTH